MTIRKGEPWGEAVDSPADLPVVADDAAVGAHVVAARATGATPSPIGVAGGDLSRTMGGGAVARFPGTVTRANVDIVRVTADHDVTWAVAHVVARRGWGGEVVFAMNAQFLGRYDIAPRSHPNDGKVDVIRVQPAMTWRDRLRARRRARTGTHLPHPNLESSSRAEVSLAFARPLDLWVDGVKWRRTDRVDLVVEADALTVFA